MEVRFSRSARKHRVGQAHALHVVLHGMLTVIPADEDNDERLLWVGPDDRGVELEVLAIRLPDLVLVIHVMPTPYRRGRR
jgi:hypothetical protein